MSRFRRMDAWGRVEAVAAVLFGALTVLTLVNAHWIEAVFDVDPDGGGGALEWLVALVTLIIAVLFAIAAHESWVVAGREPHASPSHTGHDSRGRTDPKGPTGRERPRH